MYLPLLLFVSRPVDVSEDVGQDPIGPVPSIGVQNTIKFNNTHGFRVKWERLGLQSQSERKQKCYCPPRIRKTIAVQQHDTDLV